MSRPQELLGVISFRSLDWREARLEDIGSSSLAAAPLAGRFGEVVVLLSVTAEVTASRVNRKLAAVSAFDA